MRIGATRSAFVSSASSIPVLAPQAWREPQDQLHSFELVQPVLHDGELNGIGALDQAGGAGLAAQLSCKVPVLGEGALAVAAHFEPILGEEHDDRDAVAAVDLEFLLNIRMVVAVEVADLDSRCS